MTKLQRKILLNRTLSSAIVDANIVFLGVKSVMIFNSNQFEAIRFKSFFNPAEEKINKIPGFT